jgi:WhiB family transcriptional regulator, redox-sensing transcriptional regulator
VSTHQPEWHFQAACRGADDPEMWFPEMGERHLARMAKAICATCPVIEECLNDALAQRVDFGIWGGKTVTERRILGRKPPVIRPECGSRRGYETHRRARESACPDCLKAAQRERAERRQEHDAEVAARGCGTVKSYRLHLKNSETPCSPCKKAAEDAYRKKYQRVAK